MDLRAGSGRLLVERSSPGRGAEPEREVAHRAPELAADAAGIFATPTPTSRQPQPACDVRPAHPWVESRLGEERPAPDVVGAAGPFHDRARFAAVVVPDD